MTAICFLIGLFLGAISMFAYLLTRHRATAPTMAARKRKTGKMEGEEAGVDYKWINIAGERE